MSKKTIKRAPRKPVTDPNVVAKGMIDQLASRTETPVVRPASQQRQRSK